MVIFAKYWNRTFTIQLQKKMVVLEKSRVEKCQQLKRRVAYVCRPPCFPHNLPVTVCGQTKNSAVIHVVRQADQSNQLLVCPLSSWSAQSQASVIVAYSCWQLPPSRSHWTWRPWLMRTVCLVLCHLCVYLYYVLLLYLVIYIKKLNTSYTNV